MMKAITCSQCGALINNFSIQKRYVRCGYCGAEIPIRLESIFEVPASAEAEKRVEYKEFTAEEKETLLPGLSDEQIPFFDEDTETGLKILGFIGVFVFIIAIPIIFAAFSTSGEKPDPSPTAQTEVFQSAVSINNELRLEPIETPTPFPDFSYRAYVKHLTNIGAEDVVVPVIEEHQLPTMDLAVLRKTVFKEKRIKVRIEIDTDGEVIDAKALNGHPALQEICLTAAKRSLFATRKRNAKTELTYIFVIEG